MADKDINRIELCGKLGRDAEVRSTSSGHSIVNMSVATEERWKDRQSGEWVGKTQWHRVVVKFNDALVETAKNLTKGQRVRVVGKMMYREWATQAGEKRTSAEIEVSKYGELSAVGDAAEKPRAAQPPRTPGGGNIDDLSDTIPFSPCWQ